MAEAKEKAAKNTPPAQEENSESKKTKKFKKEEVIANTSSTSSLKSFVRFLKDERTHRVTGLALLLFSLYLFMAQLSYIFTWQNDQDKVMGSWWELLTNSELKVENWLGKMGAIVSHQFIYNWFGISSFIFCYVFFLAGIRILLKKRIVPFRRSLRMSFFALLWISVTCSFIFTNPAYLYLGGSFGYFSSLWLTSILGTIGAGLFIVACAVAFLIVSNSLTFTPKIKSVEAANTNEPKITTEVKNNLPETEAEPEPINVHKNIVS